MNLHPMPEALPGAHFDAFKKAQSEHKPLVMRGFATDWPANTWSWSGLRNAVGDRTVGVRGNAFDRGQSTTFFPKPIAKKRIADYFAQLERNESSDERLFAFNLRANAPELDHQNSERFKKLGIKAVNLPAYFFGAPGSETRIHFDFDWVDLVLSHFLGTKRVLLFSQAQNQNLYQIPGTVHSAVNFGRLDEMPAKFPRLADLEGYEVLLGPGDSLYIPKGYWHHITYVTGSFSITYRIWPQSARAWLKTAYSWLVGGTDIVLNKIPGVAECQAKRRKAAFRRVYGMDL